MDELAVVALVAALIQKIIERVRDAFGEINLDGIWVNALAAALGLAFAFGAKFDVLHTVIQWDWPWWLDRAVTGIGLGAGAGWFADVAGRSGPRSLTK